VFPAEKKLL